MIIPTEYAVAFVCPDCGSLILKKFSLFALNRGELTINCKCGATPCVIGLEKGKLIYMEIDSDCCNDLHEFTFGIEEFHQEAFFGLACEESNRGIGYFGVPRTVVEALEHYTLPIPF